MNRLKTLILGFIPATLLFAWNETPVMQSIYGRYGWSDIPMHILGGACIIFLAAHFYSAIDKSKFDSLPWLMKFFILIGFVGLVGIAWEWYEFAHDYIFGTHFQMSQFDTLKDLFDDLLGGSLMSLFYLL